MITSFDSTNKVVEDRLNENRSSFILEGEEGRSFENKVVDRRRSTLDSSLDRDKSSLCELEGKEGSSKVVNSFFETDEILLWVGEEWDDK